jgi:hypothetical protein
MLERGQPCSGARFDRVDPLGTAPPQSPNATGITATLTGTTLRRDMQAVGILLIDAATGQPVPLDYGSTVTRTTAPDGAPATVRLTLGPQPRAGRGPRVPDGRHVSGGKRDAHAAAGMTAVSGAAVERRRSRGRSP